jgi:hypothetical protein
MKNNNTKESPVKWRTVVSLSTTWLFLVIGITGMVLYIVPQGRIAYWVDWQFVGLNKTDWGNIHVVAGVLFVIVSGFHIYFNWRPFLNHLRKMASEGVRIRKELWVTGGAAFFAIAGAIWHIPPIGYIVDLNETIKDSWIQVESDEPPIGHAELLSLRGFCNKTNIDLAEAQNLLRKNGISVASSTETLEVIAKNNDISPRDIFTVIKKLKSPATDNGSAVLSSKGKPAAMTADNVVARFEGTGVGRMSIAGGCEKGGEALSACMERLTARGLTYVEDDTLREIAQKNGLRSIQILQVMLGAE